MTANADGYDEEQIDNQVEAGFTNFSGEGYPNEAERENFPAVRLGMNLLSTIERRTGWTYDGTNPVTVKWETHNAGETAKFTIEIEDTSEFDVDMFLTLLYSDKNPIAPTDVETHYSTLVIRASVWERHVQAATEQRSARQWKDMKEQVV